ncbi:MAG: VOC family protein [Desulfobulbaceae bacterium]|nr:VOC family protein [Desulfobulbaceae bacterium]
MRKPIFLETKSTAAGGPVFRLWLCCLGMLSGLFIFACSPMQLTPITPVPTEHHRVGQVVWYDLLTTDRDAARQFYGQLFGWTFQEYNRYTLILNNGMPIAGIVPVDAVEKDARRGCWAVCLSIGDVDNYARLVEEIGGQIVQPPAEMVNRGRYTIISDPQGAPLVLLNSANGDPVPWEPEMGGWLWAELWTTDIDGALNFYQPLGGYIAQRVNSGEEEDAYWILVNDEGWQAGVTAIPLEDVPPQWMPVIRVADPAAVADRVPALGGQVLMEPGHPLSSGNVAIIEDPTGGIFMVQSWQDESEGKER